jgi:hypothetical protein
MLSNSPLACFAAVQPTKVFLLDGRTHYVYSTLMNWPESRAFCLGMGQDLPSITSEAQNQAFLAATDDFGGTDACVNLGATDASQEGTFVWTDGAPWTYSNWNPGEPNDAERIEDCAMIFVGSSSRRYGRWNDGICSWPCYVVCAAGTNTPAGELQVHDCVKSEGAARAQALVIVWLFVPADK